MKKWIKRFMVLLVVLIVLVLGAIWAFTAPPEYPYPDTPQLGELDKKINANYDIRTLRMEPDYSGPVQATFYANRLPDSLNAKKALLYIPGYGEYFFQYDFGERMKQAGFNFYALDLRKQGRSWLSHQRPGFFKDISEVYTEIDQALQLIQADGNETIVVDGHSLGGLIAALYAKEGERKDLIDGLFLNSPFFDWPVKGITKQGVYLLGRFSSIRPAGGLAGGTEPHPYGKSLHKNGNGEFDYSLSYKPSISFPKYLAWAKAVSDGQIRVQGGLDLKIPVLIMHSDKSFLSDQYAEDYHNSDVILDVEDIKTIGPGVGTNVTMVEVKDAMHDIFTSKPEVRSVAYIDLLNWMEGKVKK